MTTCKELNLQAPLLLPLIYLDLMQFYLTKGEMAFCGDGIQKRTLKLAAKRIWKEARHLREETPVQEQPYLCIPQDSQGTFQIKAYFSRKLKYKKK